MLSRYLDADNHVSKRLYDDGARFEPGCTASVGKGKDRVIHSLRGLLLPMKDSVSKLITHARASSNNCSLKVIEVFRSVKGELLDNLSGQSGLADPSLGGTSVPPSCDVLPLP